MVNYQLYHSNVLLGGQMKYDIVLESNGQNLIASDFHITPISSSVPYNKHVKENFLQHKHQDNIAAYYKKISGHFYNNYGDPNLQGLYPIIAENEDIDTHDSTYEMGCRRMPYQMYRKQFEFLVPLWLEKIPEGKYLNFEFQVFTNQKQTRPICKKNFILGINKTTPKFHNDLTNYFNNYFEYIGLMNGNSDVLNINPSEGVATISGFDVETGSIRVRNTPHLLTNLFSREMPLIEFDNLIISNFSDNHMIVNQLHNFNLCFNIDDILTTSITHIVSGNPLVVKVLVGFSKVDGTDCEVLEKRDFYTNYEHIPKSMCGEKTYLKIDSDNTVTELFPFRELEHDDKLNVLNYLKDHKCIDYVTSNKINPSILHWSLISDNEYIFNAYAGFAGYYLDNKTTNDLIKHCLDKGSVNDVSDFEIYSNQYTYANSANIVDKDFNKSANQLAWAKHVCFLENLTDTNLGYIFSQLDTLEKYAMRFDGSLVSGISYPHNLGVKLCFVTYKKDGLGKLSKINTDKIVGTYNNGGNVIFQFIANTNTNTLFVVYDEGTSDKFINLHNFINILKTQTWRSDAQPLRESLIEVLSSAYDSSQAITLPKSLDIVLTDGPSLSTTEIEYVKNDNTAGASILRIFGKIRPTFIQANGTKHNLEYSKKIATTDNGLLISTNKYIKTKFLPQFPSIGYYFIDSSHIEYGAMISEFEGHSYDVGKLLCLDATITTKLDSEKTNGVYVKVDDLVEKFLREYYDVTNEKQIKYIKSLYNYTMSYDYKSIDNISDYVYDVKLELK